MGILDRVNDPQDLKQIDIKDLPLLAGEIREFILNNVSSSGGHLAPSLGVVELTIALHYVYDSGLDKIIWDVGHQSYAHKILTGRKEQFATLRKFQGLSGFPKTEESIHDAFNTGHSSTSISAALGYALARDLLEENSCVAAVIGDGALTGGQAFEALNQAGHEGINMLVVLNDNEMSIAENVGAMSSYLSRLRSDPMYAKRKKDLEYLLNKIPSIGPSFIRTVERVKDSLKYLIVPGILFEELGFTYLGPIDGHNIPELIRMLLKARTYKGPVLLHVLTQKGRGYEPAEKNPTLFHGVGPFDLKTGEVYKNNGRPTYTEVFGNTLADLADEDPRIVALSAAMPEGTGLNKFGARHPRKFIDVGIAEQNAVTLAAAMSMRGFRPVVAIYSTFLQRAYDQIVHDVCLQRAPVLFAVDRAGIVGEDGPTHHGVFDYSYLRHIPQISIIAPKDENELKDMIFTSLRHDGPVALRYPRGIAVGVELSPTYELLPWGKAEVLSEGDDVLIIAVGSMVYPALETGKILKEHNISTTVINGRFIKPLDAELILSMSKKHSLFVTMEENALAGGFGSAVLELLADNDLIQNKFISIGLPDEFITHGATKILKENMGLDPVNMAKKIMKKYFTGQKETK